MRIFNKETGKFFTLADSLKPIADFLDDKYLVKADTKTKDGTWITIKGNRILLNEEGVVIGGAGGSMNGMKLEQKSKKLIVPTYEDLMPRDYDHLDDTIIGTDRVINYEDSAVFREKAKVVFDIMYQHNVKNSAQESKIEVNKKLQEALKNNPEWKDWLDLRFTFSDEAKNSGFSSIADIKSYLTKISTRDNIDSWASSSGDGYALSCALQYSAISAFDMDEDDCALDALDTDKKESFKRAMEDYKIPYSQEHQNVMEKGFQEFNKAQYVITQDYLKDKGIKDLYLYRGMYADIDDEMYEGNQPVKYQPLSSFTPNLTTAKGFGNRICHVKIPSSLILSTFMTGYGCAGEYEVAVINHWNIETVIRDKSKW